MVKEWVNIMTEMFSGDLAHGASSDYGPSEKCRQGNHGKPAKLLREIRCMT